MAAHDPHTRRISRACTTSSGAVSQEASQGLLYVFFSYVFICTPHTCCHQAKTVVAPLDRVKILFQASNPEYSKYAGA